MRDSKSDDYDEGREVTLYIWRWAQEHLTQAERFLGQAVISARGIAGRRAGGQIEGPEADAEVERQFELAWERLEEEVADSERWAEPAIYRQLERKRPRELPSTTELRRPRLELEDLEEFRRESLRFREKVAQRVIRRHGVEVARCPACNCVLVSPKAQQCRWCHSDCHRSK